MNKLPENWCVLRTPENASVINGWLNQKQGLTNFYSKDTKKYIYSNTQKGVKGTAPSTDRRSGFTLISFENFKKLVLGETSSVKTGWYTILGDIHDQKTQFILKRLNEIRENEFGHTVKWTGTKGQCYGVNAVGEPVCSFAYKMKSSSLVEVDNEEAVEILSEQPVRQATAPKRTAPAPTTQNENPQATNVEEEYDIVDYSVRKKWPGGPIVGTSASSLGISIEQAAQEEEYWAPIKKPRFLISGHPVIKGNNGIQVSNRVFSKNDLTSAVTLANNLGLTSIQFEDLEITVDELKKMQSM